MNKQFKDSKKTTFIAVCIPEFLSLYETERLVCELVKYEIDIHNIIANQVLFTDESSTCNKCVSRKKMQKKYLDQLYDLYDDFHITRAPQLNDEVRGLERLGMFGDMLFD